MNAKRSDLKKRKRALQQEMQKFQVYTPDEIKQMKIIIENIEKQLKKS